MCRKLVVTQFWSKVELWRNHWWHVIRRLSLSQFELSVCEEKAPAKYISRQQYGRQWYYVTLSTFPIAAVITCLWWRRRTLWNNIDPRQILFAPWPDIRSTPRREVCNRANRIYWQTQVNMKTLAIDYHKPVSPYQPDSIGLWVIRDVSRFLFGFHPSNPYCFS